MSNIIILSNDTTYVYNLRASLIKELIKNNKKIYIVAQALNFKTELEKLGCIVIDLPISRRGTNPVSDLKLLYTYKRIIKNIKPEFVLSFNIKPNIYGGIASRMLKVVFLPNITGLGTSLQNGGLMQKMAIILYKIGLKKARVCFFQNNDNLNFFIQNKIISNNTKTILLPGSGVDLKKHKLLKYPSNKTINFLFVARIMKDKGIDVLLEAAKIIKSQYTNVIFHVCGKCDDEDYLSVLSECEKNKIILYHGEQTDLKPFFKISNCIIHPSFHEGMANVVLEAAAHGRPVLCSNITGCKEAVDNKKNGFTFRVNDVQALVDAIKKFINMSNEDCKKMGLNGRKKVENEFDRMIVVKKYQEAIETLL